MSKYRVFVPSVSVTRDYNEGKFGVLKTDENGNPPDSIQWKRVHKTFDTAEEAQAEADSIESMTAIVKYGKPDLRTQVFTAPHFRSYRQASDWATESIDSHMKGDNVISVGSTVETVIIDTDDEEEYKPDYNVTMMVTITKRLEITVDGSECNDESDAEEEAIRMYHDGELDSDIECEYEYDRDYEIECVEEDD